MATPDLRIHRTVGIDLGTTNSVIAALDDTGSILLTGHDDQGRLTFPSVVGWDADRKRLAAGRDAQALTSSLPLSSVKRHMGLDRAFDVGPKKVSPHGASAVILHNLREWMTRALADPRRGIERAIVTMPAYFNHNQIEATRKAGELAGYEVVELLHEPTAAAIYYSWLHNHGEATYLVYDLGGGTFDVSIIRRRLGDHEVLSVSGDPFLGGDDFDRLLASHLLDEGTWKRDGQPFDPHPMFDATGEGAIPFARLVKVAEQIKIELGQSETVERHLPNVAGEDVSLDVSVTRARFERLIQDKVQRTIDCCHDALGRAKERAGIGLGDIDHVVLVGGSSRIPLVRRLVQAAFANPDLPVRARSTELLLHEPDLCVAYGAALRAAGHGTRYVFTKDDSALELHLTSPACTRDTTYQACGIVRPGELAAAVGLEGASVRIRSLATGLIEEAFLDERGAFVQELELAPDTDNALEWTVCDADGQEHAHLVTTVRHQATGRPLGQGVLPTQLITKPLAIEVLSRGRQRTKQVVAPIGATLPGVFRCTCRTTDQSGRIVVPICEENRVVHQLVIDDLDASLPVGSPVDVELHIDVKHTIEVHVRVKPGEKHREHHVRAVVEPPPPPHAPTRDEIDDVVKQLDTALDLLTGRVRSRLKAKGKEIQAELNEALHYDDEPRAIQRMAELRELVSRAEQAREKTLDPPWPRFAQLVRHCLDRAAEVAAKMGRDRDELFEHVQTQERYAEQAHEEHNQPLYRECWDNLEKYASYLEQLLRDSLPGGPRPSRPPEEEAKDEVERFRRFLSDVWKLARSKARPDLEARLGEIAKQASSLSQRLKSDPVGVLREARKLGVEVEKVRDQMEKPAPKAGTSSGGLLEGSS